MEKNYITEETFFNAHSTLSLEVAKLNKKINKLNKGQIIDEEYITPQIITPRKSADKIKHKQFDTLTSLVSLDLNVLLVGPAGSGKNYLAEQVAKTLDLDFYPVQKVSQEYALTGFIDASGKYQETSFYKAFKNGGVFFLDEMDASNPEALIVLNAAIANHYFDFPIGRINASPLFRVIAGANTLGYGADDIYTARSSIDQATLDRFEVLKVDYDPLVEIAMAKNDKEVYNLILKIRKLFKKVGIDKVISPRTTASVKKMVDVNFTLLQALQIRILDKLTEDELNLVFDEINSYLNKEDENSNYDHLAHLPKWLKFKEATRLIAGEKVKVVIATEKDGTTPIFSDGGKWITLGYMDPLKPIIALSYEEHQLVLGAYNRGVWND